VVAPKHPGIARHGQSIGNSLEIERHDDVPVKTGMHLGFRRHGARAVLRADCDVLAHPDDAVQLRL